MRRDGTQQRGENSQGHKGHKQCKGAFQGGFGFNVGAAKTKLTEHPIQTWLLHQGVWLQDGSRRMA